MSALSSAFEVGDRCQSCRSLPGSFFSALSPVAQQAIEAARYTCTYPAGSMLFMEDQELSGVSILCRGRVKLTMSGGDAKSVIARIAEPGELIGLDCAISRKPSEMAAETLDPCLIHLVKRDAMRTLMRTHYEIALAVAEQLSHDYRLACSHIRALGLSRSASGKIVHFLLEWSERGRQTSDGLRMNLPLKHEEIAQIVGVSRETVTRTLTQLKHKALITVKGPTFLIRDKSALEAMAA